MEKYSIEEINSIAKDMKYEALYWALGFEEYEKSKFIKRYNDYVLYIDSEKQTIDFGTLISVINGTFKLSNHKSFVVLECIDKLLMMGYKPACIILDLNNEYDIYCQNLYIKCFEWNHEKYDDIMVKNDSLYSIIYSSRLVSGVIERRTNIRTSNGTYSCGIFENDSRSYKYELSNPSEVHSEDFVIEGTLAKKYIGSSTKVIVPDGITHLATCLFWDNAIIEEVVLPETLINLGGDTFYNCSNLKRVNIPSSVKYMGNNPFAGCPKLCLENKSSNFNYDDGVLYNKDYSRLIYCSINRDGSEYSINSKTRIVGKHSFYLCNKLEKIVIPNSVIKLENNPFSGCEHLNVINNSSNYHFIDCVIYDRDYSSIIGCLNSIDTDELILKPVERICRNSFWNCKGIRKIIFPKSLKQIGYNPFVGCSNIDFVSESDNFVVSKGALFNKDMSTLICYPAKYAVGEIVIPQETITLERGAFSGATQLKEINLHNVSIISKTCFTNCDSLENIYCSDFVSYIGEWAFAHCKNLKKVSVFKDCFLDKNLTSNSPTTIETRQNRTNYVIESDNQFTLKTLQKGYLGKIDSILIDPPYNSKIDNIGYKDSYNNNSYIGFIEERMNLAKSLLSDKGFLVINIDKGESKNLYLLCKKIFGRYVSMHKWEKLHPYFDKNRNVDPKKKKVRYEYIIICKKTKKSTFSKIKQPYLKNNILLEIESKIPHTFRCFGTNSSAKDEIKELFGDRTYFSTPKPLKLMKELVRATTKNNSIVMDFFAGSGTVGHAVEDLNKEDSGKRTYILVSNNESNICKRVTAKRMEIIHSNFVLLD